MARTPSLKLATINATELPQTMPILVESNSQRMAWQRDRLSAMDERDLIDEQIASAERTFDATKHEATLIRDARIRSADAAMEREFDDAAKIRDANIQGLRMRQSDIDRVIAGLGAAINASGPSQPDGVQSE